MAPQGADKPSADLLRRSLASGSTPAEACPDPEILAAYFERSLDPDETAACELHLSRCARCRESLAAMARAGEFAPAAKEPRRLRLWDWRWLAPVAAALILAAFWIVRRPASVRLAEQQKPSLVAMSEPSAPAMAPVTRESSPSAAGRSAEHPAAAKSAPGPAKKLETEELESPTAAKSSALARSQESSANLPLNAREYSQSDTVDKANTKDRAAPNQVANPAAAAPAAAGAIAAAAPPAERARVAPVPPEINAGTNTVVVSGSAAPLQESSTNKQAPAVAITSEFRAQNETVVVQPADERFAETLVRTPDPRIVWRLSGGRFVERSDNAGVGWITQWTNPSAHLVAGVAPSIETCWLVGRNGMILLTTNGKKWTTIRPPVKADFVAVAATDASSATLTAADGRKFSTTDGGRHWNTIP
ncbi:MAG TPA: hypothetical protein VJO53_10380 [Candidatus Acidoferrales bacterium]|nr:hypothetical protein [Candidatus Acidoferrales bacterium]